MIPYTREAYELVHEGVIALAQVEHNGIKVDTKYLTRKLNEIDQEILGKKKALAKSEVMVKWRNVFRSKTNLNSGEQLGKVLFEHMGFESPGETKSGKHKTDAESLTSVDHPFVEDFLAIKKLGTSVQFLKGIQREVCKNFLHPSFSLHIARSFRSSSYDPNFQNLPVRNLKMMEAVRRAFISRKGWNLVEVDYSGVEVRVSACYHDDPTMINYIHDPTTDMHRDMAMECYKLPRKEITKTIRYCAKNMFVFPEFYGDYWKSCAASLWDAIDKLKLVTASGVPLKKHLKRKGITRLGDQGNRPTPGTFEDHICKVERRFWNKRFPVYTQWKKDWYREYEKRGWFLTKTGFICQGFLSRNQVINYPVQGAAFHCLLWAMIEVQKELKRRGMKAKIVGQIHDSIVADVPEEETQEYLEICDEIMIHRLKRYWGWITVPLEIEAEVTPVSGSWADKKVVKI